MWRDGIDGTPTGHSTRSTLFDKMSKASLNKVINGAARRLRMKDKKTPYVLITDRV